ncbi:MAG TPA: glycosyltransferase family 2 protein [Acidimicrobiales bacterium]|nr:glycosyltransferase family 2 protein [Acidimicrobiales bacterium]
MTLVRSAAASPAVSVVICAYTLERWDDVVAAVGSAWAQSLPPQEVILVVDHCPELLARARAELPGLVVVANAAPRPGLSGARNTGVEAARGEVVAFLDDDAVADRDWLEHLTGRYDDPLVVGVGGLVRPRWQARRPRWFPTEFDWVVGCSHTGLPTEAAPVRNLIGANMSFRRETLLDLGGFSAVLGRTGGNGLGCEETELCIRAGDRGGVLVHEPGARVHHRVTRARQTWSYFLTRCYDEGRSKAAVTRLAGARRGLATERAYLRTAVPGRLVRALAAGVRGRPAGLLTALAVVAGVASTALGYLVGGTRGPRQAREGGAEAAATTALRAAPLALSLGLWVAALETSVPLARMGDLGLVSVLPPTYWAALGVLTLSFWWAVRAPRASRLVLLGHVVLLIAVLHATPTLLYGTLRYAWAWKQLSVTAYLLQHGTVSHRPGFLSAWFAWPGFFALNAMLAKAGGLHSALSYARWGPPVNEAILLGPLVLIFRRFTADRRLVWSAVWLFYLGNWVGQDYFSPQAFAFFCYLVVIAVCLRWFRPGARALGSGDAPWQGDLVGAGLRRRRLVLYALVVVVMATVASSHQLTPFMLAAGLGVLALTRRLRYRSLPVVMMALTAAWVLYSAQSFLHHNLYWIIQSIGHPFGNAASAFPTAHRPLGQVVVAQVDRGLTAAVWALAAVGFWRRRRRPLDWTPVLILALTPILAVFVNSYGGEIDFRIHLFALPFVALYAGAAFFPDQAAGRSWLSRSLALVTAASLLGGFVLANDGKEAMNYFPPGEVAAMHRFYAMAPSDSLVVSATGNLPWFWDRYRDYTYVFYATYPPGLAREVERHPVATLAAELSGHRRAYLVTAGSELADAETTGVLPPAQLGRIDAAVRASPRFRVVLTGPNVTVYTLAGPVPPHPGAHHGTPP